MIRITICNRGAEAAQLHVLPTLWFCNTWIWRPSAEKPWLHRLSGPATRTAVVAHHTELGNYVLGCEGIIPLLFTENESNNERIFCTSNASAYVKGRHNDSVVHSRTAAINPEQTGTKAAAHYDPQVALAGGKQGILTRPELAKAR